MINRIIQTQEENRAKAESESTDGSALAPSLAVAETQGSSETTTPSPDETQGSPGIEELVEEHEGRLSACNKLANKLKALASQLDRDYFGVARRTSAAMYTQVVSTVSSAAKAVSKVPEGANELFYSCKKYYDVASALFDPSAISRLVYFSDKVQASANALISQDDGIRADDLRKFINDINEVLNAADKLSWMAWFGHMLSFSWMRLTNFVTGKYTQHKRVEDSAKEMITELNKHLKPLEPLDLQDPLAADPVDLQKAIDSQKDIDRICKRYYNTVTGRNDDGSEATNAAALARKFGEKWRIPTLAKAKASLNIKEKLQQLIANLKKWKEEKPHFQEIYDTLLGICTNLDYCLVQNRQGDVKLDLGKNTAKFAYTLWMVQDLVMKHAPLLLGIVASSDSMDVKEKVQQLIADLENLKKDKPGLLTGGQTKEIYDALLGILTSLDYCLLKNAQGGVELNFGTNWTELLSTFMNVKDVGIKHAPLLWDIITKRGLIHGNERRLSESFISSVIESFAMAAPPSPNSTDPTPQMRR